jgi:aryl-alcohol dehydrogenase-like predicted oxidoreductase
MMEPDMADSIPLAQYYTLGRTGLRVSRLALGTMTFGTEWGWGADRETAQALFDTYVDAGGNFFDTADLYTNGTSETWLGEFIAERGLRDRAVIATKFTYNADPGNPNGGGNGRKHILAAVEGSLRRLGTDHIDLYILHTWDRVTPAEEVMRTLDDLVRAGKVRHIGLSDVPARAAWLRATVHAPAGVLARRAEHRARVRAAGHGPRHGCHGLGPIGERTPHREVPAGRGRRRGRRPVGDDEGGGQPRLPEVHRPQLGDRP